MVMHRSLGRCEVGVACGGLSSQPEWHHRQLRRGGNHGPENGIAACRDCHGHIHANPELAVERGWIVSQYADPAAVPAILMRLGSHPPEPVLLSAGGTYT
jgi:hypothetical protein